MNYKMQKMTKHSDESKTYNRKQKIADGVAFAFTEWGPAPAPSTQAALALGPWLGPGTKPGGTPNELGRNVTIMERHSVK